MRILELLSAGAVVLTVTAAAYAGPPGSATMPAGPRSPGQWNGRWLPPRWGALGPPGAWGFVPGAGVPTYWVWAPGTAVFDYPFADWRGPTGGWGNPLAAKLETPTISGRGRRGSRHSFSLVCFLCFHRGSACHRWAGTT